MPSIQILFKDMIACLFLEEINIDLKWRTEPYYFKGNLLSFSLVFFPLTFFFFHSNLSHWNASSVVPPLIYWLCDITLNHHVTQLLLLLVVLAQACVSWRIRADWVFRKKGLKETVTQSLLSLSRQTSSWCGSFFVFFCIYYLFVTSLPIFMKTPSSFRVLASFQLHTLEFDLNSTQKCERRRKKDEKMVRKMWAGRQMRKRLRRGRRVNVWRRDDDDDEEEDEERSQGLWAKPRPPTDALSFTPSLSFLTVIPLPLSLLLSSLSSPVSLFFTLLSF